MGTRLISLKGQSWRGRSTRGVQDHGDRRMVRIVNGYVTPDGHEIRQFPGFKTLVDLTEENNPTNGFARRVYDCVRPVIISPSSGEPIYPYVGETFNGVFQSIKCFADPLHIHGFEQVRGNLILWGESDHRRVPIYGSGAAREELTVTGLDVVSSGGNVWRLTLSGSVGAATASDYGAAATPQVGLHYLILGNFVWVENVVVPAGSAVSQSDVDSMLNDRFHYVKGVSGGLITLGTEPGLSTTSPTITVTGNIYRTRNNRNHVRPTPGNHTPYFPNIYTRIDEADALTTWVVRQSLSLSNPSTVKSNTAWVANRQRDYDDHPDTNPYDGIRVPNAPLTHFAAVSRREQRALPYRTNPAVAGDRIVLAAPGYHCLFQIPCMMPIEPEDWPSTPSTWSNDSGLGLRWFANDIYDKPRCLGIPKGVLIDSSYPTPLESPLTGLGNFQCYEIGTTGGFAAGTYKISISYVDEVTGEEGLASEPVTFTIPGTGAYFISIFYLHPGYVMPECLANRVNVYVAGPGSDAMAFFVSFPLGSATSVSATLADYTAKYGFWGGATPNDVTQANIHRIYTFPTNIPSPIVDITNPKRLAPQSASMPRGAEGTCFARGILLSVGHSGTHGGVGELLRSFLSSIYETPALDPFTFKNLNELQVRAFGNFLLEFETPTSASTMLNGGFGVAGRHFPSAYQGLDIFSHNAFPDPIKRVTIDKVVNNRTYKPSGGSAMQTVDSRSDGLYQRLQTISGPRIWPSDRNDSQHSKEVFLVGARGQIQTGDPGRIGVVDKSAIQFLDGTKDDDGVACHPYGQGAIICSKKETHALAWSRSPRGQTTQLVSLEVGCIASNSMVTFDGGCAWISERGPVAFSGGISPIGHDLEEDFFGDDARYAADSKGMMRHCWSAHDQQRGIVLWGLVTNTATHEIVYQNQSVSFSEASDEAKSRFPCNEVLIWSYRSNAFSTWVPPSGLEILWMRPLTLGDGSIRMCFLAADKRIYALDEEWQDTNRHGVHSAPSSSKTSSTEMEISETWGMDGEAGLSGNSGAVARGTGDYLLRAGMTARAFLGTRLVWETTIASLEVDDQVVNLTTAQTWTTEYEIQFGHRPDLEIYTSFNGETLDTMDVNGIQVRYSLVGEGMASVNASIIKTDLRGSPVECGFTDDSTDTATEWTPLAADIDATTLKRVGQRISLEQGRSGGQEVAVQATFCGRAQVRVSDLLVEVE